MIMGGRHTAEKRLPQPHRRERIKKTRKVGKRLKLGRKV